MLIVELPRSMLSRFFSSSFFFLLITRTRGGNILSVVGVPVAAILLVPRNASLGPPREFSKFVPLSKDISETRRGGRVPRTH